MVFSLNNNLKKVIISEERKDFFSSVRKISNLNINLNIVIIKR